MKYLVLLSVLGLTKGEYTRRNGTLNPFDHVADVGGMSAPAFVDVDNDGDMDLVIGRGEGDLKHYYENTGSPTNPSYTRKEGASNPFDQIDMGTVTSDTVPAFVDVDNDGDMDLVIGRELGDLKFYYENTKSTIGSMGTMRDTTVPLLLWMLAVMVSWIL